MNNALLTPSRPHASCLALMQQRTYLVHARRYEHHDKDHEPREGQPTDDPWLVQIYDVRWWLDGSGTEVDRGHEESARPRHQRPKARPHPARSIYDHEISSFRCMSGTT